MIKSCASIIIAAKHGKLNKVKDAHSVAHTVGALRCKFEFRTPDWDYTMRTAVFCKGSVSINPKVVDTAIGVVLDDVDECAVPHEVLLPDEKYYSVGVWGIAQDGLRIVSEWLVFEIKDGCYVDSCESCLPTPSVYEQILTSISSKANINHKHTEYLTEENLIEKKYATETFVSEKINESIMGGVNLDSYALKSELPTKISDLENDNGFITLDDLSDIDIAEDGYSPTLNVVPVDDGYEITIVDVEGAKTFKVINGKDGNDGIDIVKIEINDNGELVISYSDHTTSNLGKVVGDSGLTPFINNDGNWQLGNIDTQVKACGKDGNSGVYVGSGEMPEECNVQINEDGEPLDVVLTVNGVKPDEDGNVEIEIGGGSETTVWEEEVLASGVIEASDSAVSVDTGITLAELKRFKSFLLRLRGAESKDLANFYFFLGNGKAANSITLSRTSKGGVMVWLAFGDTAKSKLYVRAAEETNPSLVAKIGTNFALGISQNSVTGNTGATAMYRAIDLIPAEDSYTIRLGCANTPTISYDWEIRGITK